jgi:hypothetical protein
LDQPRSDVVRVRNKLYRLPVNFVRGALAILLAEPRQISLALWKKEGDVLKYYKLIEERGDFKVIAEDIDAVNNVEDFSIHAGCLTADAILQWFSIETLTRENCFSPSFFLLQLKYKYKGLNREFFKVIKIRSNLSNY